MKRKRDGFPTVMESLGISIKAQSSQPVRVVAADSRTQRLNEFIANKSPKDNLQQSSSILNEVAQLHSSCRKGNLADVSFLLDQKPELINMPSASNEDFFGTGGISLHFATLGNQPDIVSYLISKGAKINCQSARGITPLHIASARGLVECGNVLVRQGGNLLIKDSYGKSALSLLQQETGNTELRKSRSLILVSSRKPGSGTQLDSRAILTITDKKLYRVP
jgi:hypothetical protein